MNRILTAGALAAIVTGATQAGVVCVDFAGYGNGEAIADGSNINGAFTLSSSGNNLGLAIFDASPGGVNDGGIDDDLITAGHGNVLILQSNDSPDMTGSFFDVANDSAQGGTITFDFTVAPADVAVVSLDLLDINGSGNTTIVMTDGNGNTRTIFVPNEFTGENNDATINLASGTPQADTNPNFNLMTTVNDAGAFDANDVAMMTVTFAGSAALDDFKYELVPGPAALALFGVAFAARRRRRA